MRSAIATSIGSTGTAITPARAAASACRCVPTAAKMRQSPASARIASQSIGPSGITRTPTVPSLDADSQASNKRPAVVLVGTIGVNAGPPLLHGAWHAPPLDLTCFRLATGRNAFPLLTL